MKNIPVLSFQTDHLEAHISCEADIDDLITFTAMQNPHCVYVPFASIKLLYLELLHTWQLFDK
jgi:hypothetical protein